LHSAGFFDVAGAAKGLTIRKHCFSAFAPGRDVVCVKIAQRDRNSTALAMAAGSIK